ncbi:tripartite tricarboxylate transporter substrate binding protein [Reyranella sp.]|uniref:Bug family tripartite tricarboxylate transporter substrate binding protein n=1 Tax=Reyranella sp. TaxID=1929291 RepID=UPI0027303DE1|nr:tripartite tricarboxylate transporter substrate binding protein [Reyranella sp.]MDP2376126.1 tripartite tricarboxylate transporter substrate binding protein [Reyranella sp.]
MLRLLLGAFALFLSAVSLQAQAQGSDWPTKPVAIYMGFPAGSGVDVVARILQPSLEKTLGQRLVIDYKAGAGGNVASEVVARAAPDGYTFLLGTAATHGINPALYTKLSFDVEADFTPITTLADIPNVLAINPSVIDAKDVKDFIAKVKAAPGTYSYGSTGNGTGTHLAFAAFVKQAGLDMVHVPYKGGPDATNSLLKGETCCSFPLLQAMLPYAKAGKVRLLGVTTPKRVAAMPDLPTIAEAGLPGYESYTWFGIFGPKNLPPAIAQKMNAALKTALEDPEVKAKLVELGNTPRYETLEQFKATVKEGRAKWAVVVKAAGATVD